MLPLTWLQQMGVQAREGGAAQLFRLALWVWFSSAVMQGRAFFIAENWPFAALLQAFLCSVLVLTFRLLSLVPWLDCLVWGGSYNVMQILQKVLQDCIKTTYWNAFQSFSLGFSWRHLIKKSRILVRNHASLYAGLQMCPPSPPRVFCCMVCSSGGSPAVLAHSWAAWVVLLNLLQHALVATLTYKWLFSELFRRRWLKHGN